MKKAFAFAITIAIMFSLTSCGVVEWLIGLNLQNILQIRSEKKPLTVVMRQLFGRENKMLCTKQIAISNTMSNHSLFMVKT